MNAGGVPGAPGLSGAYSAGDTATFVDLPGESGTTTLNLNGVSPSLAGLTFSASNTIYNIATGTTVGGTLAMQGTSSMTVTSGTANISANIASTGTLTLSGSAGTDLIWSGSDAAVTGHVNITSGTLTLLNPTWFGQANFTGTNNYNIAAGAVMEWALTDGTAPLSDVPLNHFTGITGSGTLLVSGTGSFYVSNGLMYMGMSQGGVIEIGNGATLGNGGNGGNGFVWGGGGAGYPANAASLQLDAGGSINLWNNNGTTVDALTGSGTLNRLGYGSGATSITIGVANGSGTFAGTIANGFGQLNLVKQGTGTEVLTGSNTFAGSTTITGSAGQGTLRITNNSGLGFGGLTFVSNGGQHTASVTGGGTLDIANGITVNHAITLNGGSLINSGTGTSVLDSGIAGITFATDPNLAAAVTVSITGGNNSATASGSYITPASLVGVYNTGQPGGASGVANDYVYMTNAGSGYTPGAAPTVSVLVNGTANTGADAAVVSQLILTGNNNFIGSGLTINAQITGAGGFTTAGSGTLTISGSNTYSGSTIISQGVVNVTNSNNGSATGSGTVDVTGAATLSGNGTIAGAVITGSQVGAHLAPGAAHTSGNFGGPSATLAMNGGLTLGDGTILDYDLGSSSDLIAVTGQLTLGNGIVLNIGQLPGFSAGSTYNLITYSGALTGSSDISTWTATGAPPATNAVFAVSGGVVSVSFNPINLPGNAYWGGAQGGGGNGTWNTFNTGTTTNWLTAQSSGSDTGQVPYSTTNVFFIANTGSNVNTYLGSNFTINSLNFTGTNGTVATGSAVTISGSIPSSGVNSTLTINATGTNGNTAGSGLTTGLGAGAETINANIALGGNQTWTLNASPSAPVTVGGTISGAHALTVGGIGQLVLAGNDTFTGGLTINGSASVVLNNAGALNSTTPDSVTFGPSSSGTLSLNGNSVAIGSLSSNATAVAPVIRNGNASPVVLTINQAASGTYGGVIRDGMGSASLSLTTGGPATLTLTGANTYTGSTTVNGGDLQVNGSLASTAAVTVNSSGTLGGSGGTIAGAVTINSGGTITGGTPAAPGTLTLGNGLTLSSGGIAAFNIINGGANDQINITSGGLTVSSSAILEVTQYLTLGGTYALMTYTGPDPDLTGVTEQNLNGSPLASNYSIVVNSGTIDLVVSTVTQAVPVVTINTPSSGTRVMQSTSVAVSGSVSNAGTVNTLSGTLSDGGGSLLVSGFTPAVATVPALSGTGFTASVATGTNLGSQTFAVAATDGNGFFTSSTAASSLDVLGNRIVTPTIAMNTGSSTIGAVHVGTVVSGTVTLSSTGADSQYTRVTVANSGGTDAYGLSISGGNPSGTFNGSLTDQRIISGTLNVLGTDSAITLVTTGEGLTGESPQNVTVGVNAQVFSGHASWAGVAGNYIWSTSNNWGDTQAPTGTPGAPGLSGALSIGDTAVFTDGTSEIVGGTTTISLNGVSPTLAGLTFSSGSTTFAIATGTVATGTIAMQAGSTISVTTGMGVISTSLTGSGLTVNAAPGSDLLLSGTSFTLSGTTTVASGTLTFAYPGLLAQGATAATYVTDAGATLEMNASNAAEYKHGRGSGHVQWQRHIA